MASDLYREMQGHGFNIGKFRSDLNELKSRGGDPNQMINELVRSGKVSQAQVNAAMGRVQAIMQLIGK